ncbi:hypothetical protein [Agrococcus citreus]|uniref:Uncharacterized protein n=1 Tax=Agrococcus citreus TaxID=84643 RepID=A0ABN1YQT1_9MICO
MTDTLARPHRTAAPLDPTITWASPGNGLWVASRLDDEGAVFLGFVEESLEEFVAVDGTGASLGRHTDLGSAKAAFSPIEHEAQRSDWRAAGATVVPRSRLRLR